MAHARTWRLGTLLLAMVAAGCVPAPDALAQERGDGEIAARCAAPLVSAALLGEARISPGRYVLTLATEAAAPPARASVPLVLRATSSEDRSPDGRRPDERDDPNRDYLYGATSLDFARVGAPVLRLRGDTITPLPTSLDPMRPGVLVSVSNRGTILTVGTLSNLRDNHDLLDGAGIALTVTRISADTVSGVWDGWGILSSRTGFFCAVRTDAPRR